MLDIAGKVLPINDIKEIFQIMYARILIYPSTQWINVPRCPWSKTQIVVENNWRIDNCKADEECL